MPSPAIGLSKSPYIDSLHLPPDFPPPILTLARCTHSLLCARTAANRYHASGRVAEYRITSVWRVYKLWPIRRYYGSVKQEPHASQKTLSWLDVKKRGNRASDGGAHAGVGGVGLPLTGRAFLVPKFPSNKDRARALTRASPPLSQCVWQAGDRFACRLCSSVPL